MEHEPAQKALQSVKDHDPGGDGGYDAVYINQVVVPATPPLFLPTPTVTRAPESFTQEGAKASKEGKLPQAISAYEQAIQADPKNPSNFINLAQLQVMAGKYKDAVTNAENALLLNPNNSMANAIRGWALAYQGDYLTAEAALSKAVSLDPNNAVAYAYHVEMLALQVQDNKGDLGTLDKAIAESKTAQTS